MKDLLRFITCGSVDDGKSTLIGHMLYDAKLIFTDQEQALKLDSKVGSREGAIDYSLLLDGLSAEREQGITIDVAYRYFNTDKRSFIVADTPGHEQYTRNMAVGAAFADLAVILVDANQGLLMQTKRHTRINALMGIKHFVLAVNKMDLVDYDYRRFEEIKEAFMSFTQSFDIDSIEVIPLSATEGDNLVELSKNTPWYKGSPLLPYLESIDVSKDERDEPFVLPVQRVSRPSSHFRGFQGQVEAGQLEAGAQVTVLPSRERAEVKALYNTDQRVKQVDKGNAVTVQFDREVDVSRGAVITTDRSMEVADMFKATILWMDDQELVEGRNYLLKLGSRSIPAMVMNIKHKIDVNTGESVQAQKLYKNEIAECDISLSENIPFDAFDNNEAMGSFILMDRVTHMTSAAGTVEHSLRRSTNVQWQATDIDRAIRSKQKDQTPLTVWFTGLSGSGKSTLANALEKRLVSMGKHTMLLDGDNVRKGLNKNLGFQEEDRIENIRRISEVSKLMNDAGLIVLASFIAPYENDRESAREIIGDERFIVVHVNTPLEVCEERDVKGLYKKARNGDIPNFTGVSSPYEPPVEPLLRVDTSETSTEEAIDLVMNAITNYM